MEQSSGRTRICVWVISGFTVHFLKTFTFYWPTYLLTPWSRVLLEKLTGSAASQEIPRIFGTPRFITVPTNARHLSLSWANSIQSSQPPPNSWRSILILSSHLRLGLPSGLFPSGFPTRTLFSGANYLIDYNKPQQSTSTELQRHDTQCRAMQRVSRNVQHVPYFDSVCTNTLFYSSQVYHFGDCTKSGSRRNELLNCRPPSLLLPSTVKLYYTCTYWIPCSLN